MFTNLHRLLTVFLTLLLLSSCSSDPFEDFTIATHMIRGENVDEINMAVRPGYLARVELKDKSKFRLEVKSIDKKAIHGTKGETIRFEKLEYVEYISPDDYSLLSRISQLGLAALAVVAATFMAIAALIDAVIRALHGS